MSKQNEINTVLLVVSQVCDPGDRRPVEAIEIYYPSCPFPVCCSSQELFFAFCW